MTRRSFKAIVEWIMELITEWPFSRGSAVGYIVLRLVISQLLMFYVEIIEGAVGQK
jgi:hypothetical protein